MIVTEHPHNGRMDRIKHYSDNGMLIRQNETGNLYAEAVDVWPTEYTYTETDMPIEQEDEEDGVSES